MKKRRLPIFLLALACLISAAFYNTYWRERENSSTPKDFAQSCLNSNGFDGKVEAIRSRLEGRDEVMAYFASSRSAGNEPYINAVSDYPEDKNPQFHITVGEKLPNGSIKLYKRFSSDCASDFAEQERNPKPISYSPGYVRYEFLYDFDGKQYAYFDETMSNCIGLDKVEAADFDGDGRKDLAVACQNEGTGLYRNIQIFSVRGPDKVKSLGGIREGGGRGAFIKDINGDGSPDIVSFYRPQDDGYSAGEAFDLTTCLKGERAPEILDPNDFGYPTLPEVYVWDKQAGTFNQSKDVKPCVYAYSEYKEYPKLAQ